MKLEWSTCFKVGISLFLLYLAVYYFPNVSLGVSAVIGAAFPLIVGGIIAYIVNILMSFYERYYPKTERKYLKKGKRVICMTVAFLTLIALMLLLLRLVVPQLAECVALIFATLPDAISAVIAALQETHLFSEATIAELNAINWADKIDQVFHTLLEGVGGAMKSVVGLVSSVFSGVITAFLSIIFAIYLLSGKDTLYRQVQRLLTRYAKAPWKERINYFFSVLNNCFHRYIVGQCTEAVILGSLCAIGMLILQLPYATMIGTLIAFTSLIPIAGAYIGGSIGALMIFSVSPMKALIFIIFLVILQQLEGQIIYPKVVGSSLGLPGIWVLAAITVGGGIMGILGMLLGVPIMASAYKLLQNDLNKPTAEQSPKRE